MMVNQLELSKANLLTAPSVRRITRDINLATFYFEYNNEMYFHYKDIQEYLKEMKMALHMYNVNRENETTFNSHPDLLYSIIRHDILLSSNNKLRVNKFRGQEKSIVSITEDIL